MLGIILGLYFRKHPGMAWAQVALHRAAEKWDTWLLAISQRQHHLGHFTQLHGGRASPSHGERVEVVEHTGALLRAPQEP